MAPSTSSVVLVAALLVNTLSYCSAENVYCVTPTDAGSCSSCPPNTHCGTLFEYAQEAELYFTSNTTMVFLPGDHTLDMNITVANVSRLTMHGVSSSGNRATVVRNGSVGFSFTNMVDFNIYSLAFTSYNRSWSYDSHPASNSALLLQSTQTVKLVNCSFHDNLGTALTVHNTSITLEENSKFVHNQCACQSFSDPEGHACGIAALNSNLTIIGNTFFHENTQTTFSSSYCGGAIWASASSLHFNGTNNFINNSANGARGVGGGAIYAKNNSSLSFSGTSNFAHNSAGINGGAITTVDNVVVTFNGFNNFVSNTANSGGGAINAYFSCILTFHGTNKFINNSADYNGGAINLETNSYLSFIGTTDFSHNSALFGGAINTETNTSLRFRGNSHFSHNSAWFGGSIYADTKSSLSFSGNSNFSHNSAGTAGGAIYADTSSLSFSGTNCFRHNSANYEDGGAIYIETDSHLSFSGVSCNSVNCGGAIYTDDNDILSFNGTNNFFRNSAMKKDGAPTNSSLAFNDFSHNSARKGGAINTGNNVILTFNGTNIFFNNSATKSGGAIYVESSISLNFIGASDFSQNSAEHNGGAIDVRFNVALKFTETTNFCNNSASDDGGAIYVADNTRLSFNGTSSLIGNFAVQGGAIFAYESTLTFGGNISFVNNRHNTKGSCGGAMYLYISSTLSILPNTTVCWENNHAHFGGAIYVYDANPHIYCTQNASVPKQKCFFQLPGQNLSSGLDVQLVFKNNSADTAGSVLYGGAIDNCKLTDLDLHNSSEVFDMLVHIEADNTTSSISSDPFHICPCENNLPDCSKSIKVLSVHPGNSYQVLVVAVGQRDGIVPAKVKIMDECKLICTQIVQNTSKTCTPLNYTVDPQQKATLNLYADGHCSTHGDKLVLKLNGTQSCPVSQENSSMCICDQALKYGIEDCTITNESAQITRHSNETFWVSYNFSFIFHPRCPFEYCVNDEVVFSLDNPDMQCAHNRAGILCGHCKDNYSLALGTFKCIECTNDNNLALIVVFAVMGVALVFLLFVCKLTVAKGTLSGLVFYANIVGANRTIFLPQESTDALSVFIAWLNLDFGIEVCFYDGMDAYSKTWLQFAFPVYLWLLVGLMILISHFSQRFANMLGSNPVSVLATLILLSYAKILRTLIATVYIIHLEYPKDEKVVWFYDATDYLSSEHILLLLVAMFIFIFLFFPYTLLLLFGPWLQAISHLRLFSWVNRLKPFMDSYHAPYKAKHRYWPGLLLVLRFVLLLVFALKPQQDPNINLLAILVGVGILQLWAWVSGGVYKNWCLDALEGSFVLNLIILGAASMFINITHVQDHKIHEEKKLADQLATGYTSVFIAFVTFIGILAYHIFQQVRETKLWKKIPKLKLEFKKLNKKLNTEQAEDSINNLAEDSTEPGNFDQLREPLLDDQPQPTHSVV